MAQTSRLVLEIDSRDAEQKAADTRKALEALEGAGLRAKPAMDKAGKGLEKVGDSSEKAGKQIKTQAEELEELLGRIDPVTRKLGELDRQERELAKNRKLGLIDADTFTDYQGKINATRADLGRFNADMTKTGISAKQTAAALRGVPAQFTDIAVSLQGGQAPLTVFLQQGGQLKDMFGGAGPAAKALGGYILGLVNPLTVAAAAAAALGAVYYDAEKEASAFNKALFSGSASSGQTASNLQGIAKDVAGITGNISQAKEAVIALAASSGLSQVQFRNLAQAAGAISEFTGKGAAEVAAALGDLGTNATKAAEKISSQYGLLTSAQYEAIRALDEQGKKQEALDLLSETLSQNAQGRLKRYKESLSELEKGWNSIGVAISNAYSQIKGELFPDTAKEIEIIERILKTRKEGGLAGAISSGLSKANSALGLGEGDNDDSNEALEHRLTLLKTGQAVQAATAASEGDSTRQNQARIAADSKWNDLAKKELSDQAKLTKDIADARKLGVEAGKSQAEIDKVVADIQAKYDKAQPKAKAYTENAGIKALDQAKQQYAVLVQQNSLIGAQGDGIQKIGAAQQALIKWEQELSDIKAKKTLTADQKSLLANQQLIGAQLKRNAALEKETELKKLSVDQSQKLLAFQENLNSQLRLAQSGLNEKLAGAGLGDQALQRLQEQQQIQQSYQSQMDRLTYDYNKSDKTSASSELYKQQTAALQDALQKRLAMQTQYYSETDKQQADWSIGASSAFQTYAEQAANVAGQTRSLFTNAFSSMEDGIVNFVKTGKLSFKDLADGIISDLIRIQVRKAAVGIFGTIFGGGATAGNGLAAGSAGATSSALGASAAGYSSMYGFSDGGYTGDGGKYQTKGVVHGGEFVVQKSAVQQPGAREFLERMNAGKGYADGGYVNPAGAVSATNAAANSAVSQAGPIIKNYMTFTGKPDPETVAMIEKSVERGAAGGYNLALRDFKKNGALSQMIRRR